MILVDVNLLVYVWDRGSARTRTESHTPEEVSWSSE
jgi:hypothetical protein